MWVTAFVFVKSKKQMVAMMKYIQKTNNKNNSVIK